VGSISGTQRLDYGIGVASAEAFAAGAGAIPNPATSTEYPARGWLVAGSRYIQTSGQASELAALNWDFDIRTMRKIDKGILYLSIVNNPVQGVGQALVIGSRVRALCLT